MNMVLWDVSGDGAMRATGGLSRPRGTELGISVVREKPHASDTVAGHAKMDPGSHVGARVLLFWCAP
jgi:hypothetical protein